MLLSAPTITTLDWSNASGRIVTVSGYVVDENPETANVDLTGVLVGTASPDPSGYFECTGEAIAIGTIFVTATDEESLSSTTETVNVTSNAPSLTLTVSATTGTLVTLSGQVTDEEPMSAIVTFAGVVTGTAILDSAGNFSIELPATGLGTVIATADDVWALSSAPVNDNVASNPPVITDFRVIKDPNDMWTFEGTVSDESPAGLIVTIGGVAPEGTIATVQADGTFSVTIIWEDPVSGLANAQTTDWWGLGSNELSDLVSP